MRERTTLEALRRGETITFDGMKLKMSIDEEGGEQKIEAGDDYIAERNGGPKLLTCWEVVGFDDGFIVPTTIAYCYDTYECVKVELVE